MKKHQVWILGIIICVASPVFAFGADSIRDFRSAMPTAYAPNEILVKFKPSAQKTASAYYQSHWRISALRRFPSAGIHHMRLPQDMTVETALEIYRNDPDVEYVEPNYYRYAATTPNDTSFSNLWGLHNSGQIVNGTAGTSDADIDAPEAWEITTGSNDVVIAVVDSGVDYNHPDLSANIWANTDEIADNSIDDDGNGYVDDIRGWDFLDGDNAPLDPEGHGTHVAGIIAAVGNNATGVTGVNWTAKIMVLRPMDVNGTMSVANEISAIEYATANGAHIINCSFGGSGFSQSEKDVIEASRAVVICAAGNDGTNNDISPNYPSDYASANIISVAATDPDDNLASFSNYGAVSVDVGAPGVNIYSTKPARQTFWSDNFDDNDISDWTTGGTNNTWGTTNALASSGSYSLTDSPGGNYLNNTDSWARAPVLNLSSHKATKLEFKLRGRSETGNDHLYVQLSTDLTNWSNIAIISGNSTSGWNTQTYDLGAYDGQGTVYIRFRFNSDNTIAYDGWYIDDVTVTTAASSYDGSEYQFLNGTSMAAPIVSGIAGLVKSETASLTHTEIKSAIENSVDAKPALSGRVATGGRANAAGALKPPAPSALSAAAGSSSQIDLDWTDNSSNESGFKIERKTESAGTYTQIDTVSTDVTSYSNTGLSESTQYYYRVRAYNSTDNSAYSNEANATTQAPSGGGDGGGCFIATAAYGSPMAKELEILRRFRDNILLINPISKKLVRIYYQISPPVADLIADHNGLRTLVRVALLPIVGISWAVLKLGFGTAQLFILLFGLTLLGFIRFRKKSM